VSKPTWLEWAAWEGEQVSFDVNVAAERTCLVRREVSESRGLHGRRKGTPVNCVRGCPPRDREAGYGMLTAAQMKGEPEACPGEEQEGGTGQRSTEK